MATWKVIMLICAAGTPMGGDQCIQAEDEWGPWKTKKQCEARARYMAHTSLAIMPPSDLYWKCERIGTDT